MDFNETWHNYLSREWSLLKSFQGYKSKVKVILNNRLQIVHSNAIRTRYMAPSAVYKRVNATMAEACISTMWRRGSLVKDISAAVCLDVLRYFVVFINARLIRLNASLTLNRSC